MINYNEDYLDTLVVMESLKGYASPKSKLTRMLRDEELLRVRRGLFLPPGANYSVRTLANMIYGPSYISFEYALAYYGLIPERVVSVTSAAYGKNKHKRFDTPVATFTYRTIPEAVFPLAVRRIEQDQNPYLIATAEKALCDTLYLNRRVGSLDQLSELLYGDLRVDIGALSEFDVDVVSKLAPLYGKKVLKLFAGLLERGF